MKNYILILFTLTALYNSIVAQNTYIDNFNVLSYSNNNGNQNWATNWQENGDGGNQPNTGRIRIINNRLRFNRIDDGRFIIRSANLNGSTSATLSLNWQSVNLDGNEELGIFISSDGINFTNIGAGVIRGNNTGVFTQDISTFISPTTFIAFARTNNNWEAGEQAFIDNIVITANINSEITINNVSENEENGTIQFTVNHSGPNSGPFSINYTTADDTAITGSDYVASTGTLNFSGTSGENQFINIPLIYNVLPEIDKTFFVNITTTSPTITISDNQGIGTIIDDTDIDNDNIPDLVDIDTDNDGIPNCFENKTESSTIDSLFIINGDANQLSPLEAEITPDLNNQRGNITITDKIDFSNSFNFTFNAFLGDKNNNGADGIAIIFHDDPGGASATGVFGEGLGAQGIQNGIVLEIDTFNNGPIPRGDIVNDHGMIWDSDNQQGVGLLTTAVDLGNLEDNLLHEVNIIWNANTQTISYNVDGNNAGTYTDDLVTNFFNGSNLVFFGFSGSTGGFTNQHRIIFNDLCDIPLFVDDDNDGLPNYLDLDSDNDGILDVVEGGNGDLDTNNDGRITDLDAGFSDTNGDGQSDNSVDLIENPDTDTDNIPDFLDPDSDNDTCFDAIEASGSITLTNLNPLGGITGTQDINGIPSIVSPIGQTTNNTVTTRQITTTNTQPLDVNTFVGQNANFTINVTANGTVNYQWQRRLSSTSPWLDLSNGGSNPNFNGVNTNNLNITNTPLNLNNNQFRVVYSNQNSECIELNSTIVTLRVILSNIITNRRITFRVNQ